MKQILSAVNYLHTNKLICHRDLKPENFLVLRKVQLDQLQLKLIDFGTAKRFSEGKLVTKVCTAHYVAPEVLKRGEVAYTEKVDVWSSGVMLYMLLCGFMPFHHESNP
jgi:calcium-dependent protein kinase